MRFGCTCGAEMSTRGSVVTCLNCQRTWLRRSPTMWTLVHEDDVFWSNVIAYSIIASALTLLVGFGWWVAQAF